MQIQLDVNLQDDGARAALQRVHNGSATSEDYDGLRRYLATADGRSVVSHALRQLNTTALRHAAATLKSERTARVVYELYEAQVEAMREDLYAQSLTAAERLVADEAVAAYVRLQYVQRHYDDATDRDSVRFWDRQLSSAQKRYLRSLETLSRIRRYEVQYTERHEADGAQQRSVSLKTSA